MNNLEVVVRTLIPLVCDYCRTGKVQTVGYGEINIGRAEPSRCIDQEMSWAHWSIERHMGYGCMAQELHEALNRAGLPHWER